MITTPNLEKFRQGDFVQYMNNVLEILTATQANNLLVANQRNNLKALTEELNATWQPIVGSELTPEIEAIDRQRDLIFTGFKLTLDNWASNHYYPEWRNAAFMLSDNIAGHGERITLMRYQQQTATFNAIINDFENELLVHLQTLNLQDWLAEIKTLNTTFNEMYVKRTQAISGHQPGLIDELIGKTTIVFRQLKSIFEARFAVAVADGAYIVPEFQQVENEWSMLGQQYNDAVSRYSGSEADESKGNEAA
ncbi:hypothetical protein F0919_07105 [Taibaiella lutea]|uniref:Uncharacterized protein n=1 Tax=Taibaiella lutea TaxID=2608001 RepID=A0A5M6CR47_9BACT|nr:DUF6261 family protein [Taibaiella lutea]KAA5537436.1 hypothetical protein F0919_07105 [Taibaiella lutea]